MKIFFYGVFTFSLLFAVSPWASELDKAIELFEKNEFDAAEEWIEKASALDGDNSEIAYHRGVIMGELASNSIFSALSYADKSLESFQRAVELAPDEVKYRHGLMMFYLVAPSIAGGDQQAAQAQLQVIQQLSEYEGLHAELDFMWQLEDQRKFTEVANKAIKLFPDLPDFYLRHGMLLQREKQYDQAIALFSIAGTKTAVKNKSRVSRYNAIYQIAKTAVLSETWLEEGIEAIESYLVEAPKQIELPSKGWATYQLAQLYRLQHKSKEARQLLGMLNNSDDDALRKAAKKLIRKI